MSLAYNLFLLISLIKEVLYSILFIDGFLFLWPLPSCLFQVLRQLPYWTHLCWTAWVFQYPVHHVDIFHQVNLSKLSSWYYHWYHSDLCSHDEISSYHHLSQHQIVEFLTTAFPSLALLTSLVFFFILVSI